MLDHVYKDPSVLLGLLAEPDWIQRRVETVEFLDREQQRHRVSLLVDVDRIKAKLPDGTSLVLLPLGLMNKTIVHISVHTDSASDLQTISSSDATTVGVSILRELATGDAGNEEANSSETRQTEGGRLLCYIGPNGETAEETPATLLGGESDTWNSLTRAVGYIPSQDEQRLWREQFENNRPVIAWLPRGATGYGPEMSRWLADPKFRCLLFQLTIGFVPWLIVELPGHPQMNVTYEYLQTSSDFRAHKHGPLSILGWRSAEINLALEAIGRGQHETLVVTAPRGINFSKKPRIDYYGSNSQLRDAKQGLIQQRTTLRSVSIHSLGFPSGLGESQGHYLNLSIRSDLNGFIFLALMSQFAALISIACIFLVLFRAACYDPCLARSIPQCVGQSGNPGSIGDIARWCSEVVSGILHGQLVLTEDLYTAGLDRIGGSSQGSVMLPLLLFLQGGFSTLIGRTDDHRMRVALLRGPKGILMVSSMICGWIAVLLAVHSHAVWLIFCSFIGAMLFLVASFGILLVLWVITGWNERGIRNGLFSTETAKIVNMSVS